MTAGKINEKMGINIYSQKRIMAAIEVGDDVSPVEIRIFPTLQGVVVNKILNPN